jgi:trehalose-phosphatase
VNDSTARHLIPADFGAAFGERLDGTPLVLLLDVDGTLAPIVSKPDQATVPEGTRATLRTLARAPGVHVALVSGRAARDATRVAGVSGLWVIGNHGFETTAPDGSEIADETVRPFEAVMNAAAVALAPLESEFRGVLVENKRWTLSVHYRMAGAAHAEEILARARAVADQHGARISEGKKVVELRPPLDVDKGTASVVLAERLGGFARGGSVLCVGDDRTDEDAFRALRKRDGRAVTVRVTAMDGGDTRGTDAEFAVATTDEVRALLEWIAARRGAA